ncbi:hypothetical protein [Methylobacterium nonmethylotrophicum]|uniref:hypothetical protein n=1 Tax=Methylobacterium nonmethylotrophicum TaxID=1141884 RepID=UPI00197C3441|nr:hypothetical protein [Methylobacterium nonmethylotrophicum]
MRDETTPRLAVAHTLRPSFASTAWDLGYSDNTIGAMLGHAGGTNTSRYVHHLDAVLIGAADLVAEQIAEMTASESPATGTPEGEGLKVFAYLVRAMANLPFGVGHA